jgi:hypothetical protein
MMSSYQLPPPAQVLNLLKGLLGMPITVQEQKKAASPWTPAMAAVYVANDDTISALLLCDLAGANQLGAALSLLFPAVALENIKAKRICEATLENLREICNVGVNLFTQPGSPRLRLRDVLIATTAPLPADVQQATRKATSRLNLDVEVPRYGRGQLALAVL